MSRKKRPIDALAGEASAPEESKGAKFTRLANRRVNNALKRINQIAPLSNKSAYDFSDEQAAAIISALRSAVTDVEAAFTTKKVGKTLFQLGVL